MCTSPKIISILVSGFSVYRTRSDYSNILARTLINRMHASTLKHGMAGAQEGNSKFSLNTAVRGLHDYSSVATTSWAVTKSKKGAQNAMHRDARADDKKPVVGITCGSSSLALSPFFRSILFIFEHAISEI